MTAFETPLCCGPGITTPPCAECVIGDETPDRQAFVRHLDDVAPSWFRPDGAELQALFAIWQAFREAKRLVGKLRAEVERLADVTRLGWEGWSDLSTVMADPNERAGRWCDLVSEVLAEIVGLEGVGEQELADILRGVMDPPKQPRCRRRPLVTLTQDTVSVPAGLSTEDFRVTLAVTA